MEVVSVLLIILYALLAVMYVMFFVEKRHSERRNKAMLDYVNRYAEDISNAQDAYIESVRDDITSEMKMELRKQQDTMILMQDQIYKVEDKYASLEMDYSQAQDAAKRINDFGSSLASIFDYDPMKAIQKGRNKEAS